MVTAYTHIQYHLCPVLDVNSTRAAVSPDITVDFMLGPVKINLFLFMYNHQWFYICLTP